MSKFTDCKGQFLAVKFRSDKKPAARFKGHRLAKVVSGVFRAGIHFANLGSVIDGIENGERGEVQGLAWGEWIDYPYVIAHKGAEYYRLYPVPGGRITVEYSVDEKIVSREVFAGYLTPSDAAERDIPPCITVKAENCVFP